MTTTTTDVAGALARVTGALPAAEDRPGQVSMAAAVARAVEERRPLVVQAGTGTGKSLAYLVPAALSGRRVVVATATKALQDQLAGKDLPFVAEHLDRPFEHAVLKGRSNYVCLQRVRELSTAEEQLELGLGSRSHRDEVARLVAWAATTADGDRAGLPEEPSAKAWAAVSVGARECPGAARCPSGEACFAEAARARAEAADVVVVNTHLYGLDLAAGGGLLPEHDVVVIDEAHALEDVVSATFGVDLGAGRFAALAAAVRRVIADDELVDGLTGAGEALGAVLADAVGRRVRGSLAADLAAPLTLARGRVDRAAAVLRNVDSDAPDVVARRSRAQKLATALVEDLDALADVPPEAVAWVEGPDAAPTLRVAPVDVAAALAPAWERVTPVLTSATIPPLLPVRVGIEADRVTELDVGSPFDYAEHALLYCALDLPDPRNPAYEAAMHDELEALMRAAGGRTLALFTSWRAMTAAAEAVGPRVPWRV
ncbi:MAG TPA: ATP-dependent DNA helicase, partial [Acidimicrobiales bacterium]